MKITSYHSHLYYDEITYDLALSVLEKAKEVSFFKIGNAHQREVGPHPRWSCQLLFTPDRLGEAIEWLLENRQGLTVFSHANTGDDLLDHTQNTFWMGEILELKLEIFR